MKRGETAGLVGYCIRSPFPRQPSRKGKVFCYKGDHAYHRLPRASELGARTAEVIIMKSRTYFFTFSPLR